MKIDLFYSILGGETLPSNSFVKLFCYGIIITLFSIYLASAFGFSKDTIQIVKPAVADSLKGYNIVSITTVHDSNDKTKDISCSNGFKMINGGCMINDANGDVVLGGSYPINSTSWRCNAKESDPYTGLWNMTAYGVCII